MAYVFLNITEPNSDSRSAQLSSGTSFRRLTQVPSPQHHRYLPEVIFLLWPDPCKAAHWSKRLGLSLRHATRSTSPQHPIAHAARDRRRKAVRDAALRSSQPVCHSCRAVRHQAAPVPRDTAPCHCRLGRVQRPRPARRSCRRRRWQTVWCEFEDRLVSDSLVGDVLVAHVVLGRPPQQLLLCLRLQDAWRRARQHLQHLFARRRTAHFALGRDFALRRHVIGIRSLIELFRTWCVGHSTLAAEKRDPAIMLKNRKKWELMCSNANS